jgi:hypothetical protein
LDISNGLYTKSNVALLVTSLTNAYYTECKTLATVVPHSFGGIFAGKVLRCSQHNVLQKSSGSVHNGSKLLPTIWQL